MSKIFQLELFVKELSIWKLPHLSDDADETCVEVTVFDVQNAPINGYVFGKSSTMNRGQNFLFTLNAIPIGGNNVFFKVFKKAFNRNKNFVGSGNIPIDKIFSDIFLKTFDKTMPENQLNPNVTSTNNPQDANQKQGDGIKNAVAKGTDVSGKNQKNKSNTNQINPPTNQGGVNTPSTSKTQQAGQKSNSKQDQKSGITQNQKNAPTQNPGNANAPSTTDPQAANQKSITQNQANPSNANAPSTTDPQAANQNSTTQNQANASVDPNLLAMHVTNDSPSFPISRLTKDVYPIIGNDSSQWGTICILMRLTSFGNFSAHPIHIHQSQKEIILQNTPNTAMYKCVPLADLRKSKSGSTGCTKSISTSSGSSTSRTLDGRGFYGNYSRAIRGSNVSSARSGIRGSCVSRALVGSAMRNISDDSNLYPCPPGSPVGDPYEEYRAEINDNALCVRIRKNSGIVRRVYDNDESLGKNGHSNYGENGYSDHVKNIPIVRGNRKYPAYYGHISSFPNNNNRDVAIYDQRPKTKDFNGEYNADQIAYKENNKISCPSDVQITRKNDDPTRDVFVLTLGRDARSGNGIQLEMKTPKNPLVSSSGARNTISSQTYDDEFVSQSIKGKSKGGKKNGNKGGKKK